MFGKKGRMISELQQQLIILQRENCKISQENNELKSILQQKSINHEKIQADERIQEADRKQCKVLLARNKLSIAQNPGTYYNKMNYFMTADEGRVFHYLQDFIEIHKDNFFANETFRVFSQVSLYAFIELSAAAKQLKASPTTAGKEYIANHYTAKNVDYLICKCVEFTDKKDTNMQYSFMPYFAFELDGSSHSDSSLFGDESLKRTSESDAFKNALFKAVGIPLIRYSYTDRIRETSDANQIHKKVINELTAYYK